MILEFSVPKALRFPVGRNDMLSNSSASACDDVSSARNLFFSGSDMSGSMDSNSRQVMVHSLADLAVRRCPFWPCMILEFSVPSRYIYSIWFHLVRDRILSVFPPFNE